MQGIKADIWLWTSGARHPQSSIGALALMKLRTTFPLERYDSVAYAALYPYKRDDVVNNAMIFIPLKLKDSF